MTQYEKALKFKQLHQEPGLFILANAWDAGSARILEHLGLEALGTTSAGLAFSLGRPDGRGALTRQQSLENAASIVLATSLPVSADLENGYGDRPEDCAETILLAAEKGLVGCTLEDATGITENPIYDIGLSIERVRASALAARRLPFPFLLTARAENFLYGKPDLDDTIRRLVAYAEAGADVLYAPGLKSLDEIEAIVRAVAPKPVNFLLNPSMENFSIEDLKDSGVKRMSLGSTLARAAYGALFPAVRELVGEGSYQFAKNAIAYGALNEIFAS
jgi:2-methylisocitrate lyase-like PEP mutase family enzyme